MTAGPAPLVDRTGRYSVGWATLASLLAGRGAYRLVQVGTTVLLLPAWGTERYGVYATAVASFSWLTALVFTGPEKAVLKLLPRALRTGPMLTEAFLGLVWWLPVPLLVAYAVSLAAGARGAPAVYLGVATMLLTTGCTLLLVGLHRAAGRPRSDVGSFLVMSVVQLVLLAAAGTGRLGPLGYVTAVTAGQLGLNAVLATRLGRPSLRIRRRRGYLRRIAWTALLMSGADVCLYLSTAVLFALLAASTWADQVSGLFVVVIVWSVAVNLLVYLLRVYAPRTSLRLAGAAGADGRRRASRLARVVIGLNLLWLAAIGPVAAGLELTSVGSLAGQIVLWGGLLATRAPALATLLWAGYLLENTDARAPRVTGLAGAAGLLTAAAAGLVAVPAIGGLGVIVAFAVAELAQATIIAVGGRPPAGRPGDRHIDMAPAPGGGAPSAARRPNHSLPPRRVSRIAVRFRSPVSGRVQ